MLASVLFAAVILLVSIAISIDRGAPLLTKITVTMKTHRSPAHTQESAAARQPALLHLTSRAFDAAALYIHMVSTAVSEGCDTCASTSRVSIACS